MRHLLLLMTLFVAARGSAYADTFFLKSGGRIEGELVNRSEIRPRQFIIATEGARITLAADQVERVTQKTDHRQRYEQLLAKMDDTADHHWKLAQWCLRKKLNKERQIHLQRVIELDLNHEKARRALGYQLYGGRWLKSKEWMAERGYIHYQGSWRTVQDVELLKEKRRVELAIKDFRRKVKTWGRWLEGRRHEQAVENLRALDDPLAASGVADLLQDARHPETKELAIEILGRIGGDMAVSALIQSALKDPSAAIRDRCLQQLDHLDRQSASVAFVRMLGHKNNSAINRSAVGLERLGDQSAILPLIKALKTEHKYVVQGSGGGINPVFGSGGDGGLSVGKNGPKVIRRIYENGSVLAALVTLTGQNYRFDENRWMDWYQMKESSGQGTLRRDP